MGLFEKAVYKKVELPFCYIEEEADYEMYTFSIEAFGEIDGEKKYLYMSFVSTNYSMIDNEVYEDMRKTLKDTQGKKVDIRLKYKKNKLVDFELEQGSLANSMKDQRFDAIEVLCSSISNETSRQ